MPEFVQADELSNGTTIGLRPMQRLRLCLAESRTAGFRWHLRSDGSPILNLAEDQFEPNPREVGGAGTHCWIFNAEQAGDARIELGYGRSWQSAPEFTRFFVLQVSVRLA